MSDAADELERAARWLARERREIRRLIDACPDKSFAEGRCWGIADAIDNLRRRAARLRKGKR